jgi:hypothetical protein
VLKAKRYELYPVIGAHYYPWYGKQSNLILGGGNWESGIAHTPRLGSYSSENREIIKEHVQYARKAGIDFFMLEWTGPGLDEDLIIREHCIPVFESMRMPFCITYDSYFTLHKTETTLSWDLSEKYDSLRTKGAKMGEDFKYLLKNYFSHPQYYTIHQRPVVFIFLAYRYRDSEGYLKKIRTVEGMPDGGPFLIGDMVPAYTKSSLPNFHDIVSYLWNTPLSGICPRVFRSWFHPLERSVFITSDLDALSGYNLLNLDNHVLDTYDGVMKNLKKQAVQLKKNWIPFVFPGYDDRNLRGENRERYCIDRGRHGEFYAEILRKGMTYTDPSLGMIIITSFNEWHEGTEIEPSIESGYLFLDITSEIVQKT